MGRRVDRSGRGLADLSVWRGPRCVLRGGQTGNHHSPSYFPSTLNLCAEVEAGLREIKETREVTYLHGEPALQGTGDAHR